MADERIKIIVEGVDKASGTFSGIGKSILGIGAAAAGIAAGALVGLGAGLISLAQAGEPIAGIQTAFENFTTSVGVGTGEMLAALQAGSQGLVSNTDLMESYNKAIQLVGPSLANQLGPALESIGKVSAATGQDMGFLLDSLVTGIGRLSPMILDNLGIQVDLNEAYTKYAESIGKTVEELSKEEQQAALTAEVLEKLATNTAALEAPIQPFKAFKTTLINLRDTIATAVLPIMTPLLSSLGEIVTVVGDRLIGVLEDLKLPLQFLGEAFGDLISGDIAGFFGNLRVAVFGFFQELGASPETLQAVRDFFDQLPGKIQGFIDTITTLKDKFMEFLGPIIEWIASFVEWKDVLIALGLAVAAFVIPALAGIAVAVAQVMLVIGGLIAAVAIVRSAWESDWMGIRTAVESVAAWFMSTGLPNIKGAIESMQLAAKTFADRWQDTFKPNIEAAVKAFTPLFETMRDNVKGAIDIISVTAGTFADRWNDTWLPNIKGALEIMGIAFTTAKENVTGAIEIISVTIATAVSNIVAGLTSIWTTAQTMAGNVTGAFGSIAAAIDTLIAKIVELIGTFADIVIPDILTPGSPTPFEMGLRGIISAVRELNPELDRMSEGVTLNSNFGPSSITGNAHNGHGSAGADPGTSLSGQSGNTYILNVATRESSGSVLQDFRLMEAAAIL